MTAQFRKIGHFFFKSVLNLIFLSHIHLCLFSYYYIILFWCFCTLEDYYFDIFFNLNVILFLKKWLDQYLGIASSSKIERLTANDEFRKLMASRWDNLNWRTRIGPLQLSIWSLTIKTQSRVECYSATNGQLAFSFSRIRTDSILSVRILISWTANWRTPQKTPATCQRWHINIF